tara:strand:+ start:390 stop:569 length:180 start_codon:yes stop_codon:yes gene_type:complete
MCCSEVTQIKKFMVLYAVENKHLLRHNWKKIERGSELTQLNPPLERLWLIFPVYYLANI